MNSLVVSGSVLLVLLLLVILWRRSKRGKTEPYELQETLFSPAERAFLGVLDLAVGDQAREIAHRMSDGGHRVPPGEYAECVAKLRRVNDFHLRIETVE